MNIVFVGGTEGIGSYLVSHRHRRGDKTLALGRHTTISIDVANASSVHKAARNCWQLLRTIDAVVLTAGIHGQIGDALLIDPAEWMKAINVNLLGAFNVIQAFSHYLKDGPDPRIICFAGGGAHKARPGFSGYGASKAGLVRLVETIAIEERWLKINILSPGVIRTRLIDEIVEHAEQLHPRERELAQAAREGSISDQMAPVIRWVDFLLSGDAENVTGRWFSCVHDKPPEEMRGLFNSLPVYPDAFTLRRTTKAE